MEGSVVTRDALVAPAAPAARRASLVTAVAVLSVLAAGCAAAPALPAADRPATHACGPATDAATARTIDVYVAVLQRLMADPNARVRPVRVLYVADRAVPYDDNAGMLPSERRRPTAPRSASTAPFTQPVKGCLASVRFPDLPPIRLVSGFDDPRVVKAGRGPVPLVADGRVVQLEGVPLEGDRLELAASSNGGGGDDAFGGLYILARRDGTWQVVGMARGWIA
jgi:hypothetical protein